MDIRLPEAREPRRFDPPTYVLEYTTDSRLDEGGLTRVESRDDASQVSLYVVKPFTHPVNGKMVTTQVKEWVADFALDSEDLARVTLEVLRLGARA